MMAQRVTIVNEILNIDFDKIVEDTIREEKARGGKLSERKINELIKNAMSVDKPITQIFHINRGVDLINSIFKVIGRNHSLKYISYQKDEILFHYLPDDDVGSYASIKVKGLVPETDADDLRILQEAVKILRGYDK
jgi:hypothetical protein